MEFPKDVYFADKDPLTCHNQKDYDKALRSIADGGQGGAMNYIRREFPKVVYRENSALDGGVEHMRVENQFELDKHLDSGWSASPIAPKPAPTAKDVTQREWDANLNAMRAQIQLETMQKEMARMQALLDEKETSKKAKRETAAA